MKKQITYRDEYGKIIDKKLWIQKKFEKKKINNKKEEFLESNINNNVNFLKYKGGIVQYEENLEKFNKGIEREELIDTGTYYINKSYDEELRRKDFWDDPIKLIKKNESNLYINEDHTRLKCRYLTPQNRFLIESGYRWDGIIRGNGFEEKYLMNKNQE